jgi:Bacterial Ig-like domain (group 2)/Lactonase, 7-bladed beta-propeller
LAKFKRFARILPVLSILGLSACFGPDVKNLFVTSTKLTPANPTIGVGATQQFILNLTYVGGMTDHESPSSTTWSSDNTAVATINTVGIATAVAVGTANILGSYQGNNTHTLLTVTVAPSVASAMRGDSRMLQVTNLRTGQEMTFATNGLGDSISVSRGGEGAAAAEISVQPEQGPGWLAADPSGRYLYVVNQTSGSISAFAINWKTGDLTAVVSSPFAAGVKAWSVEVDPDGAGLSVGHLESDEVSRFRIDPATGALTSDSQ